MKKVKYKLSKAGRYTVNTLTKFYAGDINPEFADPTEL